MTVARKRKDVMFEGRQFASVRDFKAAFPAYRSCVDYIREGYDTIPALERHLAEINAKARAVNRAGIRASRRHPLRYGARRDPSCR